MRSGKEALEKITLGHRTRKRRVFPKDTSGRAAVKILLVIKKRLPPAGLALKDHLRGQK